jgi:hypothetical protein
MTLDQYLKQVKNFINVVKKPDVEIKSIRFSKTVNEDNSTDMEILVFYRKNKRESNFTAHLYNTFSKPEPLELLNNKIIIELDRCNLLNNLPQTTQTDLTL